MISNVTGQFMDDLSGELRRIYEDYPAYQNLVNEKGVTTLKDTLAYGDNQSSWGLIDIPSSLLKMFSFGGLGLMDLMLLNTSLP